MAELPSPQQIVDYVRTFTDRGEGPPARRDIAKAFKAKGPDRAALRRLLGEMEEEGLITLEGRKAKVKGQLPKVTVMDLTGTDAEGDLLALPLKWEGEPPQVVLTEKGASTITPPLGVGDRFLGRLHPRGQGRFEAEPIKRLGQRAERVLGVFERARRGGGTVDPVSRKAGKPLLIERGDENGAEDGALVWAEPMNGRGYGPRRARIAEVVGAFGESANWSLIALANQDIPTQFPQEAIREAETRSLPDLDHHEDIRETPLVTIDPADAKDHDDAVFAEKTKSGWRVLVAIADVSWFVRPGSALDEEAQRRGNSVYLVDRVVPMLPEALSNGLCSLHEGEDRPALICEMHFSKTGQKTKHRFFRGMMRSAASLSYEEAQAAADGSPNERAKPLLKRVIEPLFGAYEAVMKARADRSPLELELPERKIVLGEDRAVADVVLKQRFDAHKLIEAFMVAANVCAAETLEEHRSTLIYRVHDAPDPERLDGLRQYLSTMDYSLPKGQVLKPEGFNRVLSMASERDEMDMVSMAVLRTQSQAAYDTANIGHFGLNLARYAHFTSPIRRYADLTVHRGLVSVLKLGPGGERSEVAKELQKIAEAISDTERRAVSAERETQDRFLAAFLQDKVGGEFEARVNGVTGAGLFVTLDETGADGFVPARTLGWEYFEHDEARNALIGRESGGRYRLGQRVRVRLLEVTPLQGGLRFEMLTEPEAGEKPDRRKKGGKPKTTRKGRPVVRTKSDNPRRRDEPVSEAPRKKKPPRPKAAGKPQQEEEITLRRRPRKSAGKTSPRQSAGKKAPRKGPAKKR
ncbi:ribonuclease R [Parvularcula oceani]|uniref:ribonuclease R n=1 Tax=Parvularcula oceani TaxID=1247963 RepID=UPI0009DF9A4D|nr:ribonuclease R [Parvularcula oceani]